MKKTMALLFAGCLVLAVLSGCSEKTYADGGKTADAQTAFTALTLTCMCDCQHLYKEKPEFDDWYCQRYGELSGFKPQQQMTVSFYGTEYTGKYSNSFLSGLNVNAVHNYTDAESRFSFSVSGEDGSLRVLKINNKADNAPYSNEIFEQCRLKAQEIAKQYIDTSYFELNAEKHETGPRFVYCQYVNGVETDNTLSVYFKPSGTFDYFCNKVSCGYKSISSAKSTRAIEVYTSGEAEEMALNKAKSVFADLNITEYTKVTPGKLFVLPDGALAKEYTVEARVQIYYQDEEGYTAEHVHIAVTAY